ncbi:MAG: protoporphyrinogen/coproporphyrinogen oxidase [Anaerolineae bacterium]
MRTDTLIVGAGPTGLSAAYHCQGDYLLLERESRVGGLCRSINDQGFLFDYAGHIFFSGDSYVNDGLMPMLLGDNVHWQYREAWVHSKGVYTRYPFQASTYGLPAEVIKECILGAIEAEKRYDPSHRPANFSQFINLQWGTGIGKHFMVPYNRKLWTVPLEEMGWEWLNGRVPQPNLGEIIDGALQPQPKPMGPNARFAYPLHGGFEALMSGWLPYLDPSRVWLDASVIAIDPHERVAVLRGGRSVHYGQMISTMPLPELLKILPKLPAEVQQAARQLRSISIRCVNLGLKRHDLTDKHWIYYPEERPIFHRAFIQSNTSPYVVPEGCSSITAEISYSPSKPLPAEGDTLIERTIEDLQHVGLLHVTDEIAVANEVDIPYAYVVPDLQRDAAFERIQSWLRPMGIVLAGRFAEWKYLNTDHCFLAGKRAAEEIRPAARLHMVQVPKPVTQALSGSLGGVREAVQPNGKELL